MFLTHINWDVSPEIFTIPFLNLPIRWYGILWATGIILAYKILEKVFVQEGRSIELLDKLALYIIIGTVVGARLGHVLFYDLPYYIAHPIEIFAIWHGGLASHGGGIGILIAIILFSVREKVDFYWVADRIALVVPLCGACIRFGNLMNSEMIGKSSDVPWAFVFAQVDQVPRHPAQLYEALFCLALFGFMWYLYSNKVFKSSGLLFATLLIFLFIFRFVDEFFKINQESFENDLWINMGQILSLPFIIGGVLIFVFNYRKSSN